MARTQGACNGSAIAATEDAARRRFAAAHVGAGVDSGPVRGHECTPVRAWASENREWQGRRERAMAAPLPRPRTRPGEGLQPPTWGRGWTRGPSAIRAHLHRAAAGAGDRPAHQQQVVLGDHLDDLEPALGDALSAHAPGPLDALEHARGGGRGTNRARGADVVRPVARRPAGEVVALDRALEALALGHARDLHVLAGLERLDRHLVADRQLAGDRKST